MFITNQNKKQATLIPDDLSEMCLGRADNVPSVAGVQHGDSAGPRVTTLNTSGAPVSPRAALPQPHCLPRAELFITAASSSRHWKPVPPTPFTHSAQPASPLPAGNHWFSVFIDLILTPFILELNINFDFISF